LRENLRDYSRKGQGGSMSIKAIIEAARRELDIWHEYGKGMAYSEFKRSPRYAEAYEIDRDLRRFVDALPGSKGRVKKFGELQDGRPRKKTSGQLLTAQEDRDDRDEEWGVLTEGAEEVVGLKWEPPSDPGFYALLERCNATGKCVLEDEDHMIRTD
jgi:hypothetical protein